MIERYGHFYQQMLTSITDQQPAVQERAYSDLIGAILGWPLWSPERPEGARVP